MRTYLNTKGSAMMLVLCSMMILIAVSSIVIMLSTANITMSKQYSNWSEQYYRLDYVAEDQLSDLDKTVLIPAENLSRYYLQNSYYQYETVSDFPSGVDSQTMPQQVRQMFLSFPSLQQIIHDKWNELCTLEEKSEYEQQMQAFLPDLFHLLYYAYIEENSSSIDHKTKEYPEYNIRSTLSFKTKDWFPSAASFDEMCRHLNGIFPQVSIKATELVTETPKILDAVIALHPPSFKAVEQNKYYAVKANPLYANALSVQGSITFQGNGIISVLGDIISSNVTKSGSTLGLDEGNTAGIQALDGVHVNILGNVYSGGDLHLWGDNSSLTVSPYPSPSFSSSLALKSNLLYSPNNKYFFDFAVASDAASYTEEAAQQKFIPYIYMDNSGGNVYCNNLAIEEKVENGTITVSGNVWTQDDIQNDGINSKISVGKNYIGMRSDANEANQDPNGSSAIINNGYMYGSSIAIGGDFIIPGTAFFQFANHQYYQTAESGTARAGEYFALYLKDGLDEGTTRQFRTYPGWNQDETYDLYDKESPASTTVLMDRIDRFQSGLIRLKENQPEEIKSGITVGADKQNYTLGIVNNEGTVLYKPYSNDFVHYKTVSGPNGILERVFQSKTQYYGTNGFAFSDLIDDSVDRSDASHGFYYYSGNETVDVSSISSGLLYCNGNLTLTGNGTFQGSIICAGNLTVHSGVKIQYNESVIREVLGFTHTYKLKPSENGSESFSRMARQFFSPSKYAAFKTIGVEMISGPSSTAGERVSSNRYTISMWKQAKA